jgi:hypothetical protein
VGSLVTGGKVKLDMMPRSYTLGSNDLSVLENALRDFLRKSGEILSARTVPFQPLLPGAELEMRTPVGPLVALDLLIARYNRIVAVVDGDLMIERHRSLPRTVDDAVGSGTPDAAQWTNQRIRRALERIERARTLQACMPPLPH